MHTVDILLDPMRSFYRLYHEEIYNVLCAGMMIFFAVLAVLDKPKEVKKEEPLISPTESYDW